jgi:hypothetical protein
MNTKLKHFLLLAALSFAFMACNGGLAKPTSGLDVSVLPDLLSVPEIPGDKEAKLAAPPSPTEQTANGSIEHLQLTTNN